MGGGLGGGSSDAATTLLALNRLWKLGWKREPLSELGLRLGADVPVFIFGESAFAEGVGEKLSAITLPPAWYLVLTPPVHVSTAHIFGSKELTRNTIPIKIPPFSVELGHNDLEPVVSRSYPEVARHLEWLKQLDNTRMTAMTGSGACVFAEFPTERAAKTALENIPAGMKGFMAQGLDRHPMHDFVEQ
jgi:4-diphosphocytidyl-2-C-methyl-D-erythritol kinase